MSLNKKKGESKQNKTKRRRRVTTTTRALLNKPCFLTFLNKKIASQLNNNI
jgi:hypothetical protein